MGLGKTVQAIAMLVSERERPGRRSGPTLVVCPMSVAQQWAREIARFAPALRVHLHHGADAPRRRRARSRRPARATSWSRRTTSRRADVERFARLAWDRLLLDEAQDAKNPRDEATRARCGGSRGGARSR